MGTRPSSVEAMFSQPPGPALVSRLLRSLAAGEVLGLPYALSGEKPGSPVELRPLLLGGVAAYGAVTEQALALARVLAEECGFNPSRLNEVLASSLGLENPLRLYSLPTAEHLMLVRRGVPWVRARGMIASMESPVDAVARASVIPLFYTKERLVAEMAAAQVYATSMDPRAAEAARLHALTLYYILVGLSPEEALEEAALQTRRTALREALQAAAELASGTLDEAVRVASRPGDMLAGLLSAASLAPALSEQGASTSEALYAAIAAAPRGAEHAAAAMAAVLLAAAGAEIEALWPLEAEPMLSTVAAKLAEANLLCRGLASVREAGSEA